MILGDIAVLFVSVLTVFIGGRTSDESMERNDHEDNS
jgi:hypothetical protein